MCGRHTIRPHTQMNIDRTIRSTNNLVKCIMYIENCWTTINFKKKIKDHTISF